MQNKGDEGARCPAVGADMNGAFDVRKAALEACATECMEFVDVSSYSGVGRAFGRDVENFENPDEVLGFGECEWLLMDADKHRCVEA